MPSQRKSGNLLRASLSVSELLASPHVGDSLAITFSANAHRELRAGSRPHYYGTVARTRPFAEAAAAFANKPGFQGVAR
jgi:hypothetical protein